MGIPKFFRWISERYPLTSQLIQENKIPEFDNLYLDFNAIIHNCSHPNDGDPHFRLSEEQIFTSIFTYVDHLFTKIRPKKLFFMAVDGVAPRAKMNQQRSRRFRTAKDAAELRAKAERKGEILPEEKAFDSNCITPGTPFMSRLSEQLKYFVNKKITEDSNWREVEVVLSGHDVPGEGEHKIMEYIRLARAQKDYDSNLRHCLYGLDADLIMLGLISHDPHFCLLREEVKFGPARKTRGNSSLESINFYLLHLSLFREYLDLEFDSLKSQQTLPFNYSLERIIDDFVLLAVFVGNDFLPNLPDLHIHENGLEKLFEIYKKVLPTLDGYLNDSGSINLTRLQCILDEMAEWEIGVFEKEHADLNWYKGKQEKYSQPSNANANGLVLTGSQREIFRVVRDWVSDSSSSSTKSPLSMPNTFPAKDRAFISTLAKDLNLSLAWDGYDEQGNNLVSFSPSVDDDDSDNDGDEGQDLEAQAAVFRVLRKYDKAPVHDADLEGDFDTRAGNTLSRKMDEWKRDYYSEKLEIEYDDPEEMGKLIYRYVEGLQWVMYYYFTGVKSWGWFYDYHYAPRIGDLGSRATWGSRKSIGVKVDSDVTGTGVFEGGGARGISRLEFVFEIGQPFRPYEQLMGVLPLASREHIPNAYHDLMTNPNSPIASFYPTDFSLDLNGKKADWEAIVKIPFIDQILLLSAMATREQLLSPEEVKRNGFGLSWRFAYTGINTEPTEYPSSLPGFFPPIHRCMCRMEVFDLPTLDPDLGLSLVTGDTPLISASAAGFPSLYTLPHTHTVLGYHHVNVHGTESKNQSIVVHIRNTYENWKTDEIGKEVLGKRTFIGWPFLQEGMVVALSDDLFRYEKVLVGGTQKVIGTPHNQHGLGYWRSKADRIENVYSKRFGVVTGPVEVLLHVRPLKGLKRLEDGSLIKDYEGMDKETEAAVQMTISSSAGVEDPRFIERPAPKLEEEFPEGSRIFFLGEHAYGVAAQVSGTTEDSLSVVLAFFPSDSTENAQFKSIVHSETSPASSTSPSQARWHLAFTAASILNISNRAISKITSSFMIITSDGVKHNLGLSIKFEAKGLKVVGYSRKGTGNEGIRGGAGGGARQNWEYSDKAINLMREYMIAFPEIFRCLDVGGDAMLKASDVLPGANPDLRVREIKSWLKSKGVRDFEPVPLACDQLSKETVYKIEKLADSLTASKSSTAAIKKAIVKGIPRQAVLKPSHAIYRLQGQRFALGDRVTMVMDSGAVPLAAKGVVVGLNEKNMDVAWDVPFMSGTTLGDRCSQYRGLAVEFNSCLNLSDPQFVTSTKPNPKPQLNAVPAPFKSRFGSHQPGQVAGFRSVPAHVAASATSPATSSTSPTNKSVHIMTNPNRGGIGARGARGRGAGINAPVGPAAHNHTREPSNGSVQNGHTNGVPPANDSTHAPSRGRGRGFVPGFRGRGTGFPATFDRGRSGRGFRGRGRGFAPQIQAQTSPS